MVGAPNTWANPSCLSGGEWTAVIGHEFEYFRAVPTGLSDTGDPWVAILDNSEWLATTALGMSSFTVLPSVPGLTSLGLATLCALLGLAGIRKLRG